MDQQPETQRFFGPERLIGFTDAVVAIAATLLVLPLVEIVPQRGTTQVATLLRDYKGTFLAFVLSFLVIYRFWHVHHRIIADTKEVTAALLWLNGLWLLCIVFLPFPTQLIGTGTDDQLSWVLYIGTMLVASASTSIMQWLLGRSNTDEAARESRVRLPLFTATMAVALILAATIPGAGPWSLLLLIPAGFFQRVTAHSSLWRRARRADPLKSE